jgi:hypothetical protein
MRLRSRRANATAQAGHQRLACFDLYHHEAWNRECRQDREAGTSAKQPAVDVLLPVAIYIVGI